MRGIKKDGITFLGEFTDKDLEREFFNNDMKRYEKCVGPIAMIYGTIYMMFLIADYFAIESALGFQRIVIIRGLFLMVSALIYVAAKKINNYTQLAYLITAYEGLAVMGFLGIIDQYESLTLLSFFSVVAITLAIYVIPNKLSYAQVISIFLSLSFFIFYANRITGMDTFMFLKLASYSFIIITYCNIGAYLTHFYKRKHFAENRELLRISITDSLTGLYNRAKFNEEFNRWATYCNDHEIPLALVVLDIDDFKRVNDSYGHLVGDQVIQNIALITKKTIRSMDIAARWGGEEFVILFPNTDIHQAREIMESMRICIQNNECGTVDRMTCSFGLASLKKNESPESLLQRADKLLYDAKAYGKNVVICELEESHDL